MLLPSLIGTGARGTPVKPFLQGLTVALVMAFASVAWAQSLDQAKIADAIKAKDALVALGKDAYQTGRPPRQSDPKIDALLNTALQLDFVPLDTTLPRSEFGNILTLLTSVLQVGTIYITAGTGTPDLIKASPAQVDRNTVKFASEIGRYIDAQLRISEALIRCLAAAMAADPAAFQNPQTAAGLQQIRTGTAQTVNGVLDTVMVEGLDDTWRRQRIAALAHFAPWAAKFVSEQDVQAIRDHTARDAAMKPVLADDLGKVFIALKRK